MDIWGFNMAGQYGVKFLSARAHAWRRRSEHYSDIPNDSVIWMNCFEYEELALNAKLDGLSLIESGTNDKEH